MTRRLRTPRALALAALMAAALVGTPARATFQPFPVPQPPLLLRLDATIFASRDAAREAGGFTEVSLGFPGTDRNERRWLAVEDARTLGADTALDGRDVLAMVAPLQPNLFALGPERLLEPLVDASPGTKVRVEGLVLRGSRTWYLRSVKVGADAWEDAS